MEDVGQRPPSRWNPARVQGCGEMLGLLRDGRAQTIGDLADAMDMARSTVVQRVEHLVADGLVIVDRAKTTNGRGRPAVILRFNSRAGAVLVGQVGVTGARVAVADLDGRLLAQELDVSPLEAGPDTVVERLIAAFDRVVATAGITRVDLRGIGIGWPGSVGIDAGRGDTDRTDVGFTTDSLIRRLRAEFGLPVLVDEDVNLLALGEHRSSWPTTDVLVCVKVGSIIGCGTVIGGEVVRGAQHVAGRIGHLTVPGNTTPCHCGNVGCLDAVAGGAALVRRLRAGGLAVDDVAHLVALAGVGVPEAVQAIRTAGRHIGDVLAYAVNLLNPGVIAFWGYLIGAERELLAGIRESIYQHALPAATHSLQLVRATVGDSAGLIGAATMVVSDVLAPDLLDERLARSLGQTARSQL
jgi:predicted NBD/HSP70 family sugar kinase